MILDVTFSSTFANLQSSKSKPSVIQFTRVSRGGFKLLKNIILRALVENHTRKFWAFDKNIETYFAWPPPEVYREAKLFTS